MSVVTHFVLIRNVHKCINVVLVHAIWIVLLAYFSFRSFRFVEIEVSSRQTFAENRTGLPVHFLVVQYICAVCETGSYLQENQ